MGWGEQEYCEKAPQSITLDNAPIRRFPTFVIFCTIWNLRSSCQPLERKMNAIATKKIMALLADVSTMQNDSRRSRNERARIRVRYFVASGSSCHRLLTNQSAERRFTSEFDCFGSKSSDCT